jgi:uncharacterized protein (DUF433 family)
MKRVGFLDAVRREDTREVYERISIDPRVCHGQACIRGTRIPVHQIVRMLAYGDTIDGLLEDYPSLERDDILAALDYAASLAEEQIAPLEAVSETQ